MLLKENEYNQLEDITINITFNFKELNGFYTLMVYKKTIEWVLSCDSSDALFYLDDNDREIYIATVDGIFNKYNTQDLDGLCHPTLELQHNHKKISYSDGISNTVKIIS